MGESPGSRTRILVPSAAVPKTIRAASAFGASGFLSSDGDFAHCSREQHAGGLTVESNGLTYAHRLAGRCKCGKTHGPAAATTKARAKARPTKNGVGGKSHAKKGHAGNSATNGAAAPRKPYRERLVATFYYLNAAGLPILKVDRLKDPKSFAQYRDGGTDASGRIQWVAGTEGVDLVPYRLPELITAMASSIVFIPEGEKHVDALRALGLVATCNPMGAGKWRDEFSPWLAGRPVVILPDNDDPGRRHAEQVARSVSPHAASVKVVELPGLPEKGDVIDWLAAGHTAEELLELVAAWPEWEPSTADPADPADQVDDRPTPDEEAMYQAMADDHFKARAARGTTAQAGKSERVDVEVNTERHIVVAESIAAFGGDPDLYHRGESLVTVVQETADEMKLSGRTSLRGIAGSPRVIELAPQVVGCFLTRNVSFYRMQKDKEGEPFAVDMHPPDWLIKAVATHKHWPGVRQLAAVVECPFPRPDGSIVETPGYDRETATLYLPTIDFPPIPDKPTRDDARAAWTRLKTYVDRFPFPTEDDRVIFLAGLMNVIGRPAVAGPVPGIVINGNRAGTGKGLLVDAMTMPGTGRPTPTSSYPDKPEEAAKVKVAIVLSGKPVVNFDNLDEGSFYGGSAIDSLLTSITIDDRVLGFSRQTGEIAVRVACFLNGNNLAPVKDAWRRWLVGNLMTDLENPEQRKDLGDIPLRARILEDRGTIVRDVLTIMKAHALAKWPTDGWGPMGSFEDWDRVIRGAVWFATERDCLATQKKTADEAPDRQAKIALLEAWNELPGGASETGLTVADAVDLVEKNPKQFEAMRCVLMQRGRAGKPASATAIGSVLRGLKKCAGRWTQAGRHREQTTSRRLLEGRGNRLQRRSHSLKS